MFYLEIHLSFPRTTGERAGIRAGGFYRNERRTDYEKENSTRGSSCAHCSYGSDSLRRVRPQTMAAAQETPPRNQGRGKQSASAIKDLVTYESPNREQESFFILNTEKANDLNVLCNLYSPLVEVDNMGKLQPAVATEWGTEDGGLTWTFKLRDDVKWVDINGNVKA